MNINGYMENGIKSITKTAARFYLTNKKGRQFLTQFIPAVKKSNELRKSYENKGQHIPPFLIGSIASQCNLACSGCYARAEGVCTSTAPEDDLTLAQWEQIFYEASALGISFMLLAGGEPLLRKDIVEKAAQHKNMVFPIFTNGTLMDDETITLFDENRNLIPVLSIEGTSEDTDMRRGAGIADTIDGILEKLKSKKILFGLSITVTRENRTTVTDKSFVSELKKKGCGLLFYVEYVPAEIGTEHLVLTADDLDLMEEDVKILKAHFKSMILLSFPGDEQYMDGCLAAGRGFFHINPTGNAEPCPFSPYSQLNLKENSILDVLKSSFFKDVQKIGGHLKGQGGCALFKEKDKVEQLLKHS